MPTYGGRRIKQKIKELQLLRKVLDIKEEKAELALYGPYAWWGWGQN